MKDAVVSEALRGAGFLIADPDPSQVTLPEDPLTEARHMGEVAQAFVAREVDPVLDRLEDDNRTLLKELMRRAGKEGLFGADVPKEYGGLALGRVASLEIAAALAPTGGFAAAQGAQVGIGSLPLVFFGTEAQKDRYLRLLASGEWVGAFGLTEPETGSDALHAKSTAIPDGDGFILNGEKQWITNAGIADLFVIFAQVPEAGLTAFLVERRAEGLAVGPEYRKLGIHASSTCPVYLRDVRVGRAAVLGEIGKGHQVALGVLNFGRVGLASAALGSSKAVMATAIAHASWRHQFDRPILDLALIREKLAQMELRIWALEGAVYRTAGLTQMAVARTDLPPARSVAEYVAECSAMKVYGSEALDFVVDEAFQIFGGWGYMQGSGIERAYRDARINRIFEGTNEINRLSIAETVYRRALKGTLRLLARFGALTKDLPARERPEAFADRMEEAQWLVRNLKDLTVLSAGRAAQAKGEGLRGEQEVLVAVADLLTEAFIAESAVLRAVKTGSGGHSLLASLVVRASARHGADLVEKALSGLGIDARAEVAMVRRLLAPEPRDDVAAIRTVATWVAKRGAYVDGTEG